MQGGRQAPAPTAARAALLVVSDREVASVNKWPLPGESKTTIEAPAPRFLPRQHGETRLRDEIDAMRGPSASCSRMGCSSSAKPSGGADRYRYRSSADRGGQVVVPPGCPGPQPSLAVSQTGSRQQVPGFAVTRRARRVLGSQRTRRSRDSPTLAKLAARYPPGEPYDAGMLEVGDGQRVYWQTCGNPAGKPAVVLPGRSRGRLLTGLSAVVRACYFWAEWF